MPKINMLHVLEVELEKTKIELILLYDKYDELERDRDHYRSIVERIEKGF